MILVQTDSSVDELQWKKIKLNYPVSSYHLYHIDCGDPLAVITKMLSYWMDCHEICSPQDECINYDKMGLF